MLLTSQVLAVERHAVWEASSDAALRGILRKAAAVALPRLAVRSAAFARCVSAAEALRPFTAPAWVVVGVWLDLGVEIVELSLAGDVLTSFRRTRGWRGGWAQTEKASMIALAAGATFVFLRH